MRVFRNLFGDESKIHSDCIAWYRVDTLSTIPIEITSADYTNPTVVPLKEDYHYPRIYAVEFLIPDVRNSHFGIIRGSNGMAAGAMFAGYYNRVSYYVNRIRVSNNSKAIGFYGVTGVGTGPVEKLYVGSIYAIG